MSDPAEPISGRDTSLRIRVVDGHDAAIAGSIVQVFASPAADKSGVPMTGQPAIYIGGGDYYTRVRFDRPGDWSLRVSYNDGFAVFGHEFAVRVVEPPLWSEERYRMPIVAVGVALALAAGAFTAHRRRRSQDFAVVAGLIAASVVVGWATLSYGRASHEESALAAKLQDPAISSHVKSAEGADGVGLTGIWITPGLAKSGAISAGSLDASRNMVFRVSLDHLHQPLNAQLDRLVFLRNNRREEHVPLLGTVVESQSAHHVTALVQFAPRDETGKPVIAKNDKLLELVVRGIEGEPERIVTWDIYGSALPAAAMVESPKGLSTTLPLVFAFLLGSITFLSRCIPHTMTVFFTVITGMSVDELVRKRRLVAVRRGVLLKTLAFVAGFTVVFVAAGAVAGLVGQFLRDYEDVISKVAGAMVILIGLHILGALNLDWLHRLYPGRLVKIKGHAGSPTGTFLLGSGFAVGCAACVAPQLYTVLIYAGTTGTAAQAMVPVGSFSLGMTVPYFVAAFSLGGVLDLLARLKRYLWLVPLTSGALSISLGLLMLFSNVF